MSVIIRLQNLPWSANALDIRQFFHGLSIPEGGVHIVGGELGDAFIAFSTDEDARQAFARNNGKIKEVQISLMLSSRTEMQKVIEAARAQSYAAFMQTPQQSTTTAPSTVTSVPLPTAVPNIIPAPVPDIKKENNNNKETSSSSSSSNRDNSKSDKRDKKRSRSRSRDRKDRRDRRRDRDRTRSRSRERRERRRRERSRSRGRSRSKERRNRDRRRIDEPPKKTIDPWSHPQANVNEDVQANMLNSFGNLDDRRNIPMHNNRNGFQPSFGVRPRNDNWPQPEHNSNFLNRSDNNISNSRLLGNVSGRFSMIPRNFSRSNNDMFNNVTSTERDRDQLPDSCVKLQPFYGGYGEIRRFFQGSFISNVGIKFINDDFGHRTGIVYIQFGHPQGKNEALLKSGETLNGVKVEVTHLDDDEFDQAIDRYLPDNYSNSNTTTTTTPTNESVSKFRTNKSISKFFNNKTTDDLKVFSSLIVDDLPTYVKEQDILKMFSNYPLISIILTTKQRGGHIGYVKFGSADEARKALEETSNHIVEGKAVTVKPCSDQEFDAVNQQHNVDIDCKTSDIDTDCINITRLPLQTNNVEITDFFSDIGVRPLKIHLMNNRLGFTGQAFCEFTNADEVSRALKKDGDSFGPNQVSVQPIPRDEMENILQQANAMLQPNQSIMAPRNMMGQNRLFFPRNSFDAGRGGGPPRFMNRGPRSFRFSNHAPHEDAPPGCTVYMDNVPYKAGTNEILDFFDGYDITNNVSRRFNPNNTPSAEAKVIFTSPDEAYRAVQDKNGHKIWDRPIYLKQV